MDVSKLVFVSVLLLGVITGLTVSQVIASGGRYGSNPFSAIWEAVAELQSKVESLEEQSLPQGFMTSPAYDSGWVDITDKWGQYFIVTHDLDTTSVFVDITGKQTLDGGEHQRNLGGTGLTSEWSRRYHIGPGYDYAQCMIQTSDGGYALAGYSGYVHIGTNDFAVFKADRLGNMEWSQNYAEPGYVDELAYSVVQTFDAGYAIAGYTGWEGAGDADFRLVKTRWDGYMQWSKTYGGTENDMARSVVQTFDGGYAIAGYTYSFGAGGYDFWLVKTDSDGNMQWNRTYGGTGWDGAYSMVQTDDGGYAMAGYTHSFGVGGADFWLVKTDAAGNMQWSKTYGGPGGDWANSIVQTSNGGYALAGSGFANLLVTDASGNQLWNRTYGVGVSVVETEDGGYAIAGGNSIVKIDSDGNVQWRRIYGGGKNYACSVVQTFDGGYAIAGSIPPPYSMGEFWLAKIGVEMGLTWTDLTDTTITLYRGRTDAYWNYVRVRIWSIKEST